MVIVRLADRELLFANRAFFDTFRVEPGEIAGYDEALYGDPVDREAIFAELVRVRASTAESCSATVINGELFTSWSRPPAASSTRAA